MQWATLPSECRQRKVPFLVVGCRYLSYLRFLVLALCPIRSKLSHKFMLLPITRKAPYCRLLVKSPADLDECLDSGIDILGPVGCR